MFKKKSLKAALQDNLATTKFKVCSILCELIKWNPFEQSRYVLEVVINKLGDPDYQVASRVLFNLKNLCKKRESYIDHSRLNFLIHKLILSVQVSANENGSFKRSRKISNTSEYQPESAVTLNFCGVYFYLSEENHQITFKN